MRRNIRLASELAAMAATLALASCGGGSGKTTTGGTVSTPSPTPAATSTTPSTSPPDQFRQLLIERSNATPAQATCVTNAVLKKIGRAKFDRLYGKGSTPADVRNVILQATERCAPNGFGR